MGESSGQRMRLSGPPPSRRASPKSVGRSETWESSASTAASLRRNDSECSGSTWSSNAQEVESPTSSISLQRPSAGVLHAHPRHGQRSARERSVSPWELPERFFVETPPQQVPVAIKPFKVLSASDCQKASASKQASQHNPIVSLGELPDWMTCRQQDHKEQLPETIRDIMAMDAPPEEPHSAKRRFRRLRRSSSSRSGSTRSLSRSNSAISGGWEALHDNFSEGITSAANLKRGGTKGSGDGSIASTIPSSPGRDATEIDYLPRSATKGSGDGSMESEMSTQTRVGSSRSPSVGGASTNSSEDAERLESPHYRKRSSSSLDSAQLRGTPSSGESAQFRSSSRGESAPFRRSSSSLEGPQIRRSTSIGSAAAISDTSRRRPSIEIDEAADSVDADDSGGFPTAGVLPDSSSSLAGFASNPALRRSKSEKVRGRSAPRINLRRAKTESPSPHGPQAAESEPMLYTTTGGLPNRCTPLPEGPEGTETEEPEEDAAAIQSRIGTRRRSLLRDASQTSFGRMLGMFRATISGKQGNASVEDRASADPDLAVIILDWDDTLLPTSFIKQVVVQSLDDEDRDGPIPETSPYFLDLQLHAGVVEELLRAASQVARVAIVTLATRWWVHVSAERYLPGLDLNLLLQELNLTVYPADRQSAMVKALAMSGRDPCKVAKKNAMLKCLKKLYADNNSPWNVISIGDSTIEQEAIKECLGGSAKQKSLCKTVKLPESMSLGELRSEVQQIVPLLPHLVSCNKDFDRNSGQLEKFCRNSAGRLLRI